MEKAASIKPVIAPKPQGASAPKRWMFPLKYKFLAVLMLILLSALSIFFYVVQRTFSEDKKLFVLDLNLSVLKAATSDIKMEIKSRLEELQIFVPRIYSPVGSNDDPFQGLSPRLKDELFGVEFLRKEASGALTPIKQYSNVGLLTGKEIGMTLFAELAEKRPINHAEISAEGVEMLNRSLKIGAKEVGVLTFLISGTFLNSDSKDLVIVVDYSQEFLRQRLQQSDLAELFLIFKKGNLLSHPSLETTVAYANVPFPHPVVSRMKDKMFVRQSLELDVDGEPYLCNLSETGFTDVMAVSQTRKSEAFLALRTLYQKTLLLALIILSASVVVSIFFASGLTSNIQKLKEAAERIGAGHLNTKISIRTNDEINSVAESFEWMADRLKSLILESTAKALLEDELETARLVQSTLLSPPKLPLDAIDLVSHYAPATQCGGDYWDAVIVGNTLTVFIGDATGHGAPAAIVTAVAKSCFTTLNSVYNERTLSPEDFLSMLNAIIYNACQGKLLMTMCVLQLNLETGDLAVANAGHESPFRLRANSVNDGKKITDKKKKGEVDVIFARGERLGFNPQETFHSEKASLAPGDIILLYTDGISEARNAEGKEWGERLLKKTFADSGVRPLSVVRKQIVAGLEKHAGKTPQADDVTFVLLSWKHPVGATEAPPKLVPPVPPKIAARVTPVPPKLATTATALPVPKPKMAPPAPLLKELDEVTGSRVVKAPPVPAPLKTSSDSEQENAKREALLYEGREIDDDSGDENPPESAAA